jgi:membrane associated rhomboid family serine protease
VFGYFGVWKRWELQNFRAAGLSADSVWKFLLAFTVFNAAILLIYPNIAWQAHIGGFVTGWLLAPALRRPPPPPMWDA